MAKSKKLSTQPKIFKQSVWTTERVDNLMEMIREGNIVEDTPFFDGVIGLKRPDITFEYTPEELSEWYKCSRDPIYFINKYCYCKQDTGMARITLRPYQEEMLRSYVENRFTISLTSRQVGKTISACLFLIWYTLFNTDKTCLLLSNVYFNAKDILDKLKEIMYYLPFFLKPGIQRWNAGDVKFDNGCRIVAQATTPRSGIGMTINVLYCDEFAHVEPHILDEFYENAFPTVSSLSDSKIIITSTPNGFNRYYDIYQGAIESKNTFHPIRVDWWQVPGRDDAWAQKMIDDLGPDGFATQYGNSFLSSGSLLLNPDSMSKLQKNAIRYEQKSIPELEKYWEDEFKDLTWDPNFNPNDELTNKNNYFLFTVDLSEGTGHDYSVINIWKIGLKDRESCEKAFNSLDFQRKDLFKLVQVGTFHSNESSLEKIAKLIYILQEHIIHSDNLKIIVEYNMFGSELIRLLSLVFGDKNRFDPSTILKYKHSIDTQTEKIGLKITSGNKPIMCADLRYMIGTGSIQVNEKETVGEFETFSKVNNTWKASGTNHDDLVMTCCHATTIFTHRQFAIIMDDIISNEKDPDIVSYFNKEDPKSKPFSQTGFPGINGLNGFHSMNPYSTQTAPNSKFTGF